MKTIEKKALISQALLEVWKWKDEVYNDVKDMRFEEKQEYYRNGLREAAKMLKGKLKTNPDGSFSIVR